MHWAPRHTRPSRGPHHTWLYGPHHTWLYVLVTRRSPDQHTPAGVTPPDQPHEAEMDTFSDDARLICKLVSVAAQQLDVHPSRVAFRVAHVLNANDSQPYCMGTDVTTIVQVLRWLKKNTYSEQAFSEWVTQKRGKKYIDDSTIQSCSKALAGASEEWLAAPKTVSKETLEPLPLPTQHLQLCDRLPKTEFIRRLCLVRASVLRTFVQTNILSGPVVASISVRTWFTMASSAAYLPTIRPPHNTSTSAAMRRYVLSKSRIIDPVQVCDEIPFGWKATKAGNASKNNVV